MRRLRSSVGRGTADRWSGIRDRSCAGRGGGSRCGQWPCPEHVDTAKTVIFFDHTSLASRAGRDALAASTQPALALTGKARSAVRPTPAGRGAIHRSGAQRRPQAKGRFGVLVPVVAAAAEWPDGEQACAEQPAFPVCHAVSLPRPAPPSRSAHVIAKFAKAHLAQRLTNFAARSRPRDGHDQRP